MDNSLKKKRNHLREGRAPPKNPKPRIAAAKGRVKPLARLLRCATALRVTAPLGCGSRRLGREESDPPSGRGHSHLYVSLREGSPARTRAGRRAPVTIRDLVRHALRHWPDHIVVGEVRGGERPTCCKPSTPDTAARSPPSMRTTPTAPCPAWRAARMQGVGELPWDVTCRGVVDGIAPVIHMTRREGAAIRGRSRPGARLRRRDHYMGHPPTRPRDGPRPSRTHRRIVAARQTGGPAAGGDARVRPHS